MATAGKDKISYDKNMNFYQLDIFHLEKEESVHEFLNRLPSTIVIKDKIKTKKGKFPKYSKFTRDCSWTIATSMDDAFLATIYNHWLAFKPPTEQMSWLQIMPLETHPLQTSKTDSLATGEHTCKVLGGSMISPIEFLNHWEADANVKVQEELSLLVLTISDIAIEIKLSHDLIHKHVIVYLEGNETILLLNIKCSPILSKLFRKKKVRIPGSESGIPHFGLMTCFCLCLENKSPLICDLQWCLRRAHFCLVHTQMNIRVALKNKDPEIHEFDSVYTWKCLCSLGYKVLDHLNSDVVEKITKCRSFDLFEKMTERVSEKPFFHFMEEMQEAALLTQNWEFSNEIPKNYTSVRMAVLTPSRFILLPNKPVHLTRILRLYNNDYFILLAYRDDDFDKVCGIHPYGSMKMVQDMKRFFINGFEIHDRHYDFLGCSNSELRNHSFWFFSSYDGITAEFIRQNCGDLSMERCVASYVSKIGLCFSPSLSTLTMEEHQEVRFEEDVRRNGLCFTDGIGKISRRLAAKVAKKMNLNTVPSVFQICYGGCKGMIALDPSLGENREILVIRHSMKKFESSSKSLEVLQVSRPVRLHLNRQVITLLSGLGIQDDFFQDLQETMLFDLSDMLLDNEVALKTLKKLSIEIDFENLFQKGISFVCEPFFRSLLMNIFHRKIKCVQDESRIQIPLNKGRLMMGSVDETKKLESGQVFIQYSLEPSHLMENLRTVLGKVVVMKSNSFHPEDLKVYEAVDIPCLGHMVDCIVFSQHGQKPHQCDSDGDGYFVCWDERLHSIKNETQENYSRLEKSYLNHNMTVQDIIEFLANYIQIDNLDAIANSYLVMADLETDGIFSSSCIELANMYSEAVNFLKFGNIPSFQKYRSLEKYPYLMTKSGSPRFIFSKVLGKLHSRCRLFHPKAYFQNSFARTDEYELTFEPLSESDIQHAISQRNKYNTNFLQIMNVYGIETENEAFTGLIKSLQSRSCFQNEGHQVESTGCAQIALLFERTRKEFFEEFGGINNISVLTSMLILRKALAWHKVTFEEKDSQTNQILSFPWTVGDILCQMKLKGLRDDAFEKIDRSLETKIRFYESDRKQTSIFLQHLRQTVQTNIPHDIPLKWITCHEHGIILPKCFIEFLEIKNEDLGKCISCLENIEDISFKADFPREAPFSIQVKNNKSLEGFMTLVTDEKIIEMSRNMNKFLCQYPSLRLIAQYILENLLEQVDAVKPNDVVIAWMIPIMLLQESSKESVDIHNLRPSTISYLLLCCCKNARYFIQKLFISRELPIISLQWLAKNRETILQMCLNIYMEIALCLNVDCHTEGGDTCPLSETFFLPVESWGTNVYARTYASSKLTEISGADIYSSCVSISDIDGIQFKAIGTDSEIVQLYEILHVLAVKSKTLQSSRNGRLSVGENISILFEGAADDHEFIQFEMYQGPCQKGHENIDKHIPRLLHFTPDASRDRDTFQRMFLSQWQNVRNKYSTILHGDLSIVLAFGNFYMFDVKEPSLLISELKEYMGSFPERLDAFLANKFRYRSRVEYSFSFLPMNSHLEKFENLLLAHFLKTKTEKIVKVRVSDYGMCDLDYHQNVLQFHLPEIRWFIGQIIRKPDQSRRNKVSVRCKMQSYRNLNRNRIKSIEGNEDIMDEISSGKLFHRNITTGMYIVKSEKIQYIREKETEIYSNRSLRIENKVWRSLQIEMSKISEYEVGPYSTNCTKLPERTEIAIIPPIPDTKATDDEIKNYVDDLWDIVLYFGNAIDNF